MCAHKLTASDTNIASTVRMEERGKSALASFPSNQCGAQQYHHHQQAVRQHHGQHHHHHRRHSSSSRIKPKTEFMDSSKTLDRLGADRPCIPRSEDGRRRRSVILEKEEGSFGFTIQSYGIHYKRDGEGEVITYVDFVKFGGSAFRAGLREGDVILSINGRDMERADHTTLVNFIQTCGNRMRMVVHFEDCVRKVELHMRYIHLQQLLHEKMSELERLCHQEKALLSAWRAQGCLISKHLPIGSSSKAFLPLPQVHHRNSGESVAGSSSLRRGSSSSRTNSPRRDCWSHSGSKVSSYLRGLSHEDPWIERNQLGSPVPRRSCEEQSPNAPSSLPWMREKPRSWDNLLTTKSFGGYGYGYGFIDPGPLKDATQTDRLRSVSSYQLEKQEKSIKGWSDVGSRTIPRPKGKQGSKGNERLVSPLNSSSCFSCDCLSIDPRPLDACLFANPKSSESLLAPRALIAAPSDTSLVGRDERDRRRSRTTSLVDCLGGNRKEDMTHL